MESVEAEITVEQIRGNKNKELNKVRIAASDSDLLATFMPTGVARGKEEDGGDGNVRKSGDTGG